MIWLLLVLASGPLEAWVAFSDFHPDIPLVYVDVTPPETELDVQEIHTAAIDALIENGYRITSALVYAPNSKGEWLPLPTFLPTIRAPEPRETERWAMQGSNASAVVRGVGAPGQVPGALAGKTVYISQAHGFTWTPPLGRWATQRGNTHGIVEDLVNSEGVNHFLIPYLHNAGALVFPVREPDKNPSMVIVDNDQAALTGAWDTGPTGWAPYGDTIVGSTNPFKLGDSLLVAANADETAQAAFHAVLPQDGTYGVNVAWSAAADRASNARIVVRHAGGDAVFQVDQRRHGGTWIYLGQFRFRADDATVIFSNQSDQVGATISADAVRFGGGMGTIERGDGAAPAAGPTSHRPRWEECSRYHSQFQGAPSSVYNNSTNDDRSDDVGNRSRYSAWQNEVGEDAVFFSWHSNAPSPARGTSTWVYGPNPPNGQTIFTGVEGSDALAQAVHTEVIDDIRSEWDPEWKDRGVLSAWFGELNPNSNPEMPATLIEAAFHDTEADANFLAEPRFRRTVARAVYHGIVRYFAQRDGQEPVYAPEPPVHFQVFGNPDGTVTATWEPAETGHAPTAYRIWTSDDGFGFQLKDTSTEPSIALTDTTVGQPLALYVTATNAGGESFPTSTLSVLPSCNARTDRALIVQGFTRLDRFGLPVEDLSAYGLGNVVRFDADRVNTFDYSKSHGAALAAAGIPFDAAEASAVEAGLVPLPGYHFVDWILGEESTENETFSAVEQEWVAQYLDGGGKLLVSGSEIAWDLDFKGTDSDRAFAQSYLHVAMLADDAETNALANNISFDEGYAVDYPDLLLPQAGAEALWHYDNDGVAAVSWLGDFGVVTAGFPLETVSTAEARNTLMAQVRDTLAVNTSVDLCTVPPAPDTGSPGTPDGVSTRKQSQRSGQIHTQSGSCGLHTPPSTPTGAWLLCLVLALLWSGRRYLPQV